MPLRQKQSEYLPNNDNPVVISAEPGEKWMWCYIDISFIDIKTEETMLV